MGKGLEFELEIQLSSGQPRETSSHPDFTNKKVAFPPLSEVLIPSSPPHRAGPTALSFVPVPSPVVTEKFRH